MNLATVHSGDALTIFGEALDLDWQWLGGVAQSW